MLIDSTTHTQRMAFLLSSYPPSGGGNWDGTIPTGWSVLGLTGLWTYPTQGVQCHPRTRRRDADRTLVCVRTVLARVTRLVCTVHGVLLNLQRI